MNLRLSVTEEERDLIRRAAALAGYRSMAAFCKAVVLSEAHYIDYFRTPRDPATVEAARGTPRKPGPKKGA